MTPLKAARLERGVTQVVLSQKTGFTQQAISYAERCGSRSDELYRRAAAALGCSPDDLRPTA